MPNSFPFAVRLIGFSEVEADFIETIFADERGRGYGYFNLTEDNLQDPDLYLVNADELRALAQLSDLHPSDIRPALLVGSPTLMLPYPCLQRPLRWDKLFAELDKLIEKRADALSRLEASDIVTVPERRRRDRLDLDLTDPTIYQHMRRKTVQGGVLIVDKSPALRDYLQGVFAGKNMQVAWVATEEMALAMCSRKKFSAVLINTSTPGVDPYRLCETIKNSNPQEKTTVIFLVGKQFSYDQMLARQVGNDGFLTKPLATNQLLSVLKKFLPLASVVTGA